jgi:hypothetical protein
MEGGRLGLREGAGVGVVDGSDGVAGGVGGRHPRMRFQKESL